LLKDEFEKAIVEASGFLHPPLMNGDQAEENANKKLQEMQEERIPGQHVDGLYDALRKWRAEVVDGSNGSLLPWNVLNNQTLVEISKKVPLSLQELGLIGGIGKKKQEAYGNGVLRVIVTFLQDNQVQLTGGLSIPSLPAAGGGGGGAGAGDTGSSNQQSKKRSANSGSSQRQGKKANSSVYYDPATDNGNDSDFDDFTTASQRPGGHMSSQGGYAPSQQHHGGYNKPQQQVDEFGFGDDDDAMLANLSY
jgi:hypothetical protein